MVRAAGKSSTIIGPKWLYLACIAVSHMVAPRALSAEQVTNAVRHLFNYERFDASSAALYRSPGFATNNDDNVTAMLVDTSNRVWIGTVAGLTVYDGERWDRRTFPTKGLSSAAYATLRLLGTTHAGPDKIVEGPPGTVWVGGRGGVWRYRDGRYDETGFNPVDSIVGMAADTKGRLWLVVRDSVYRYDGQLWNKVLCPYRSNAVHRELPELRGIAIETNGTVWIGGTVYGEPKGPWEHEGPIWVVDQERKQPNNGPPMAPLVEFDGKRWRAFGPGHGLNVAWAIPFVGSQDRITIKTAKRNYYVRHGESWRAVDEATVIAEKTWILQERRRGFLAGYAELLFRVGDRLVEVQARNVLTGEVLDLGSEQMLLVQMAEDRARRCVWLGTTHGVYRIWREELKR